MTDDAKIKKYIQQVRKEANIDLEKSLKRHTGALTEDFNDKLYGVAEMVGSLMTDMTEVKSGLAEVKSDISILKSDMTEVKETLAVVQSDVEIIKNDLKQKVDRSEFEALVKRVSFVEKKLTAK